MSAYENFRKNVEYSEGKGKDVVVAIKAARHILDEVDNRLKAIEKLQALLKDLTLQEGDVVHETGYPDEKGDIIEVRENEHEAYYRVKIRHSGRTIVYYREELEFIERTSK